jgi:hypothetical protein
MEEFFGGRSRSRCLLVGGCEVLLGAWMDDYDEFACEVGYAYLMGFTRCLVLCMRG